MKKASLTRLVASVLSLFSLLPLRSDAQQTIQLVNDNSPTISDSDVWVLFVGNPASVTKSTGKSIFGVRNLAIPIGSVTTAAAVGAKTITATLYKTPSFSMPSPPFPITFISGGNAGRTVKVMSYNSGTGVFTVSANPGLAAQAAGDQISIGAYSQPLSTLPKAGTIKSKLSGKTQTVYQVNAQLDSGVVFVSYGQLTYGTSAPAISGSKIAYQPVEITTPVGAGATTSDLTVIDFFSIPLQIESIDQSSGATDDIRTFYFSKATIEAGIQAFGAKEINNVLYLGPGQVAAASSSGNPRPFPSFEQYLTSLKNKKFTIAGTEAFGVPNPTQVYGITVGGNYTGQYGYSADVSEDRTGNFTVTLTPIAGQNSFPQGTEPSYFPSTSDVESITINLPKGQQGVQGYDSVIYGAVLNSQSFSINLAPNSPPLTPTPSPGPFNVTSATTNNTASAFACSPLAAMNYIAPFTVTFSAAAANPNAVAQVVSMDAAGNMTLSTALTNPPNLNDSFTVTVDPDDVFTQLYTNSIYSWVVAEFLSGVNFGFPGSSQSGISSAEWFSQFPQNFPFGVARGTPDDGFYNPWAAYFYNASDAYGFAFSDRVAPSPLMSTNPANEFLRITVLPETQLDAPFVTQTAATNTSITLSWPTQSGASYNIEMQPDLAGATPVITSGTSTTTATISNLNSGSPYTFIVTASDGKQQSLALPFYTNTTGNVKPVSGDLPVEFSFTWAGNPQQTFPAAADSTIYINGSKVALNGGLSTGSNNFITTANSGTNIYVLEFMNAATKQPIFQTSYVVDFSGTSSSYNFGSTPILYGTEPGSVSEAGSGPFSPGVDPVVATSFYPSVRKEFAPVETPVTSNPKPDVEVAHHLKDFHGGGIFNRDAQNQTIDAAISRGESDKFYVRIRNKGKRSDAFRLIAVEQGAHAFEARYFLGNKDVTEQITSRGGLAVSRLGRRKWRTIRIEVEAKDSAHPGAKTEVFLKAKHYRSRNVSDSGKFVITAKP